MPPVTLARPRLMQWAGNNITEHNRRPISISTERIEKSERMANGTLRKYFIADKRTFNVSWEMVPRTNANTVDGNWGGDSMINFYNTTTGSFTLTLYYGDGTTKVYTVVFTNFDFTIEKRGAYDMWNINCEMTEV